MPSLNKVVFSGPLVRDVTLRQAGNSQVANFTLLNEREFKKQDGTVAIEKCYMDVECWGATAQNAASMLRKDSMATVEGRLKFSSWTDKVTNQPRSKHVIFCEQLIFNEMVHKTPEEIDSLNVPQPVIPGPRVAQQGFAQQVAQRPVQRPKPLIQQPQYPPRVQPAEEIDELPF